MIVERLRGGPWGQNCFMLSDGGRAILVDPGGRAREILDRLRDDQLELDAIINTHGHFDHIGGVHELVAETGCAFHISALEVPIMKTSNMLRFIFKSKEKVIVPQNFVDIVGDESTLNLSGLEVLVYATPGHTPGGYCFVVGDHIFTGDTVLTEMPGSAELPGGDPVALRASLDRLGNLPSSLVVHPGHGVDTTLGSALAAIRQAADRQP